MKQGMLWYDSQTARDVYNSLNLAVTYFKDKYGYPPECCFVHPDMLKDQIKKDSTVKVLPDEKVLRNHIWMEFHTRKVPTGSVK
jgi:hypothetical protein